MDPGKFNVRSILCLKIWYCVIFVKLEYFDILCFYRPVQRSFNVVGPFDNWPILLIIFFGYMSHMAPDYLY